MKKVLLVEDQVGFVTQELLEGYGGMVVTLATQGHIAIELFAAQRFDGVLLDLRLPVLDGLVVLEAIKKIDSSVPVVVLSAYGDKTTRQRCADRGAAAFFNKPPDYLKLHGKLASLMAQRESHRFDTIRLDGARAELLAKMRRLNKLKEQAARSGVNTPPEILTEIEDLERELYSGEI